MGKLLQQLLVNQTGAVKAVTHDTLLKHVKENVSGTDRGTLLTWIPTVFTAKALVLRLPAGLAAQPTVSALMAAPGVSVIVAGAPAAPLAVGDYRFTDLKKVLMRIHIAECGGVPLVAPQPDRTAGLHENKNISLKFILKHAQDTLEKAAAVAVERFTATKRFVGEPAPTVSQNIELAAYRDFRNMIDTCAAKGMFETVEAHVEALSPELLKTGSTIDTVQYITAVQHDVRSFNYNFGAGQLVSETPPKVAQYIQFALTRESQLKHLIVNHFTTPVGAGQPRPATGDWREVEFRDLAAKKATVNQITQGIRPRVFYRVAALESRVDI